MLVCRLEGNKCQPLEEECVKGREKLAMPKGLIPEMKVKRKIKGDKQRCIHLGRRMETERMALVTLTNEGVGR